MAITLSTVCVCMFTRMHLYVFHSYSNLHTHTHTHTHTWGRRCLLLVVIIIVTLQDYIQFKLTPSWLRCPTQVEYIDNIVVFVVNTSVAGVTAGNSTTVVPGASTCMYTDRKNSKDACVCMYIHKHTSDTVNTAMILVLLKSPFILLYTHMMSNITVIVFEFIQNNAFK